MPSLSKSAPATSPLPAMAPSADAGARKVAKKDAKSPASANGKAKPAKEDGAKRKRDAAAADDSPASGAKKGAPKAGKDKPAKSAKAAEASSNGSPEEKAKKVKRTKKDEASGAAEDAAAASTKKKAKKAGAAAEVDSEGGSEGEASKAEPLALTNFAISDLIKDALVRKGIKALFPIQAQTFNLVLDNQDLVARARTGQGKTLAFVLPILECLLKQGALSAAGKAYGRPPRVIVLAPTRELAKQVGADFEHLGEAVKLKTVCVYGGAPMGAQEGALRRGVDVVVGTPGRVKDLLQRGSLSLKSLSFRVLDEADEMLNMGFVDDVEAILGAVEDSSTVQTLLFSATIPAWVNKIADRFLKKNRKTVDLVGEEKLKASASVRHLLLPCHWTQRSQVVTDLVSCYGRGGRVIVFTETKNDASSLAEGLSHVGARPLHGDIAQNHRESTLAGFRGGAFSVLVATDVAARGLDISDVQLVVQCSPPQTEETYIHRSGRTGRAGNTGVSVTLTGGKKDYMIGIIEKKAGVKFERISVPQPADIARASATTAAQCVRDVSDTVVPLFRSAAEQLVEEAGVDALDLLAKALAKISGNSDMKRRSLLTAHDDATTMHFKAPSTQLRTPTYVFSTLRRLMSADAVDKVRRMSLTADGHGAVFDVPSELMQHFLDAFAADSQSDQHSSATLEVAESLPELQNRPESDRPSPGGGFSRGWGGGGSRGGSCGGRGGRGGRGGGGRGRR